VPTGSSRVGIGPTSMRRPTGSGAAAGPGGGTSPRGRSPSTAASWSTRGIPRPGSWRRSWGSTSTTSSRPRSTGPIPSTTSTASPTRSPRRPKTW